MLFWFQNFHFAWILSQWGTFEDFTYNLPLNLVIHEICNKQEHY